MHIASCTWCTNGMLRWNKIHKGAVLITGSCLVELVLKKETICLLFLTLHNSVLLQTCWLATRLFLPLKCCRVYRFYASYLALTDYKLHYYVRLTANLYSVEYIALYRKCYQPCFSVCLLHGDCPVLKKLPSFSDNSFIPTAFK